MNLGRTRRVLVRACFGCRKPRARKQTLDDALHLEKFRLIAMSAIEHARNMHDLERFSRILRVNLVSDFE